MNRRLILCGLVAVLAAAVVWLMWPSSDPMKHFDASFVDALSVTVNGQPLPDEIRSDAPLTILVRFLKPSLPAGREYQGFILLRNQGGEYPKPPEMPLVLVRVREVGEPREVLMGKVGESMLDVTPSARPANDPECHYVAFLNPARLPKGVSATSPIELHIWIYERDDAKLSSGTRNGDPSPSVLIYQKAIKIVDAADES